MLSFPLLLHPFRESVVPPSGSPQSILDAGSRSPSEGDLCVTIALSVSADTISYQDYSLQEGSSGSEMSLYYHRPDA